jgi:hypothetical protein
MPILLMQILLMQTLVMLTPDNQQQIMVKLRQPVTMKVGVIL